MVFPWAEVFFKAATTASVEPISPTSSIGRVCLPGYGRSRRAGSLSREDFYIKNCGTTTPPALPPDPPPAAATATMTTITMKNDKATLRSQCRQSFGRDRRSRRRDPGICSVKDAPCEGLRVTGCRVLFVSLYFCSIFVVCAPSLIDSVAQS